MMLFSVMSTLSCCTLLQEYSLVHGSSSTNRGLDLLRLYERFREYSYSAQKPINREKNLERARRINILQDEVPEDMPFPCDVRLGRSGTPPDSVHRLRPGDIDVVAAMGDSLTAGLGIVATGLRQVLVENKGLSWNIGGEGSWRQFLTLPNILKEFNPQLVGFSLNDSLSHQWGSQFNVAERAAMSRDLLWQARILTRRLLKHPKVDFNRHWKLVTLLIGDNDFCYDICYGNRAVQAVADHKRDLLAALDYLRNNLPRTLVNIVITPHLDLLRNFTARPPVCELVNLVECPCMFGFRSDNRRGEFSQLMTEWQKAEIEVATDDRYANLEDFAVVYQPFPMNANFPQAATVSGKHTDYSFLSQDCFHFSQKGNARAANALWNNMLEPVGEKSTDWQDTFSRFLCPTEVSPYIYTATNSRRRP